MESVYQRRNASKEPLKTDSNRFLDYPRSGPRYISSQRAAEEVPRSKAIDARLATVYDKMKCNNYIVLTNYSEDIHPNLAKSNAWKETINEIDRDSQRISTKPGGFTQVVELLSKFQVEIFEILRTAKRIDEINLKAKL